MVAKPASSPQILCLKSSFLVVRSLRGKLLFSLTTCQDALCIALLFRRGFKVIDSRLMGKALPRRRRQCLVL